MHEVLFNDGSYLDEMLGDDIVIVNADGTTTEVKQEQYARVLEQKLRAELDAAETTEDRNNVVYSVYILHPVTLPYHLLYGRRFHKHQQLVPPFLW